MSFPAYPKYKDSGAEWLGDIPIEWDVPALRRTVGLITEKAEGSGLSVGLEDIMGWSGRYDPKGADYESDGTAFNSGDVLYGKLRPYLAKVWAANTTGAAVGDFHVLRPTQITSSFLVYCLLTPAAVSILDGATHGAKMPRVSWDALADLRLPLPSTHEQLSITAFLDRETAKINAAVAAQERLIALLAEKRAATISHAVTKGLDPDAPMKDSGIEWLGQIPAHWDLDPIRRGVAELSHKNADAKNEDYLSLVVGRGVIPYAEKGDIGNKKPEDLSKCKMVRSGDFVLNSMNFGIGAFGRSVYNGVCSPVYVVMRANSEELLPEIFSYLMQIPSLQRYAQSFGNGILAHRAAIGWDELKGIAVGYPPLKEQRLIVDFLDKEVELTDSAILRVRKGISLMRERRAALISAAVTGKIDVRGEVDAKEQGVA